MGIIADHRLDGFSSLTINYILTTAGRLKLNLFLYRMNVVFGDSGWATPLPDTL